MKLFQALKEKQKLAGEIAELKRRVQENNSYIVGNEQNYSTKETLEKLFNKEKELIDLKVKIQEANRPIYHKIFELAELKGRVLFLKGVFTDKGIEKISNFNTGVIERDCEITQVELDKIIDETKSKIYELQDELDIYNHTTEI